jgi:hypothetical protein
MMQGKDEEAQARVGLLGELEVEMQLAKRGWHPVRLDTAQMASNADLMAIKSLRRVSIQVKTTNSERRHSHSKSLGFGYSTGYLRDGNSVFNSKSSPLQADVVVAVSYLSNASRFVVLPVAFAERLCREHADYWYAIPAKKRAEAGKLGRRSHSFPLFLNFIGQPKTHSRHHERMRKNLIKYEDAWDVLNSPLGQLHDAKAWPLLK